MQSTPERERVISPDGTAIAYERQGSGPAVILVGGALLDPASGRAGRAENEPLARALAADFTVYNYDRRGRAESGDTLPYAMPREIEDLGALISRAGGSAHVYGLSSGGGLALEAAAAGLAIDRLAVYEVPYSLGDDALRGWRAYVDDLGGALAGGRRGEAIELFMRVAGAAEAIPGARRSPMWPALEAIAPTLAYDAACLADGAPPVRLANIARPTLVLTGGGAAFFEQAGDAIASIVPGAHRKVLGGQAHVVDPAVMASELRRFFTDR